MKFLPTINLWADGVEESIRSGKLVLQKGQWVVCGAGNKKARYAGKTSAGSLLVAHEQGSPTANRERFQTLLTVSI